MKCRFQAIGRSEVALSFPLWESSATASGRLWDFDIFRWSKISATRFGYYKTISSFDFKVSKLEFRNNLEELQVRIEIKQLNKTAKYVILNNCSSEVIHFKNVIKGRCHWENVISGKGNSALNTEFQALAKAL